MSEEKDTIDFLTSKIKQLELDVQYELHQTNQPGTTKIRPY